MKIKWEWNWYAFLVLPIWALVHKIYGALIIWLLALLFLPLAIPGLMVGFGVFGNQLMRDKHGVHVTKFYRDSQRIKNSIILIAMVLILVTGLQYYHYTRINAPFVEALVHIDEDIYIVEHFSKDQFEQLDHHQGDFRLMDGVVWNLISSGGGGYIASISDKEGVNYTLDLEYHHYKLVEINILNQENQLVHTVYKEACK